MSMSETLTATDGGSPIVSRNGQRCVFDLVADHDDSLLFRTRHLRDCRVRDVYHYILLLRNRRTRYYLVGNFLGRRFLKSYRRFKVTVTLYTTAKKVKTARPAS